MPNRILVSIAAALCAAGGGRANQPAAVRRQPAPDGHPAHRARQGLGRLQQPARPQPAGRGPPRQNLGRRSCLGHWPTSASAPARNVRGAPARTRTPSSPPRTTSRSKAQTLPAGIVRLFIIPQKDADWTRDLLEEPHLVGQLLLRPGRGRAAREGEAGEERVPRSADLRLHRAQERHADRGAEVGRPLAAAAHRRPEHRRTSTSRRSATSCATRRASTGADWQQAARYALQNKHPAEALAWADTAVNGAGGIGQENFKTLMTLAEAQERTARPPRRRRPARRRSTIPPPASSTSTVRAAAHGRRQEGRRAGGVPAEREAPSQRWPVNSGSRAATRRSASIRRR